MEEVKYLLYWRTERFILSSSLPPSTFSASFTYIFINFLKQTEAEICIGAFEALCYILKAIASASSTVSLELLMETFKSSSPKSEDEPLLDYLFETFLGSINNIIGYGELVRSRRAVLMNWKVISDKFAFTMYIFRYIFIGGWSKVCYSIPYRGLIPRYV